MQPEPTPTANDIGDATVNQVSGTTAAATGDSLASDLLSSLRTPLHQVVEILPRLLAACLILVVGFLLAMLFARVAAALAEKLGLQRAAERGGLAKSMHAGGIKRNVPQLIGVISFWLVMTVFLVAAFDLLGLPGVAAATERVVTYIPKVLVAAVVVVVGMMLATFLRGAIATSADRIGLAYAQLLGAGCYYLVALMTLIAAFEQLEITFELLNFAVLIAFGAVALALGLSFGLGGRDVAAGMLCGYYVRQRFQPGDHITIAGHEGTVREVGPVATIIDSDEKGILKRRSIPNHLMLKDAIR